MEAIGEDEARWRAAVGKVLKGAPVDSLVSRTLDGLAVEPLYPAAQSLGRAMRQRPDRPWRIVQRIDHPDPASANELALADLLGGADALEIVFAGSASARGFGIEPGGLGEALRGVELDLIAVRLSPAPGAFREAAESFASLVAARRLVPATLDVDFGIDPLGAMAFAGAEADMGDGVTLLRELEGAGFVSPMLRADVRVHHEAGASEAEELAASLATALSYLRALEAAGWDLAEARRRISFLLCLDADQFLGIAKLRALRRLWAAVERSCGLSPEPARVAAETSGRMMSRLDPAANWLRVTTALLAAGVGGADQVSVLPHSSALGLPDAFSRRMARNAQMILLEECGLARVADPAAGSGAVEAMTEDLAQAAWALFQEIEQGGGMEVAVRSGRWAAKLAATSERRRRRIADGETPLVGTTLFRATAEAETTVLRPAEAAAAPGLLPARRDAEPFEGEGAR